MTARWAVCQLGFREQYAIARALVSQRRPLKLITDFWAGEFLANLVPTRHDHSISRESVTAYNISTLIFQLMHLRHRDGGWPLIEARNKWFSNKAGKDIDSSLDIVFAYSYAALEIFEVAKSQGKKTVLGQIDPGYEEHKLVSRLQANAGIRQAKKTSYEYWDRWTRECELADVILVNSMWSRAGLLNHGVEEHKIKVVPLAVDSSLREERACSWPVKFDESRPLRILFLGQLNLRKGIFETTEAVNMLQGYPVEWCFVGTGEKAICDKLGQFDNVRMTGQVAHSKIDDFYQKADVFLLPTHSDGFALTQLEALRNRLPIIASRFCGEVVKHGETGIVIKEVDADSIVSAILKFIENPALISEYSEAAVIEKQWTIDGLGESLVSIEAELMSEG